MTSKEYIEILQQQLVPNIWTLFEHQNLRFIFQQDGAPAHQAKATKEYLSTQQFQVLQWPADSPNLSPIENAWAIVDAKLRKKKFKSIQEFSKALNAEWLGIDITVCQNLILSVGKRVENLIKSEGKSTEK